MQGLIKEFTTKFRIDYLSDHSILDYVDLLHGLSKNEPDGPVKSASSETAETKKDLAVKDANADSKPVAN